MSRSYHSGRPKLACEIAPDRIIAGRAADSGQVLELCSTSELSPGCLVPDLIAIARSVIVDKHQGTIGFETEEGRGTTFIIHLPLLEAAPEASA